MAPQLEAGRLYDPSGTLIPMTAPPPAGGNGGRPPIPPGVDRTYHDRWREYFRGLTPGRLEQILMQADAGDPYELVQLCEQMAERDPKIGSVLHTRTAAVLGLNHEIRPVKLDDSHSSEQDLADEIARFCDDALDRAGINELDGDLMDSVMKPIAVDWIDWGVDANGKVVPLGFRRIPPTHLRWGQTSETIRVYAPGNAVYAAGEIGVPFEPYTTVRLLNNERRDSPQRAGLGRSFSWYYLFKTTSIKDWVAYADRFGTPDRILSIDPSDFTNKEMYDAASYALSTIGAAASGVISKNWSMDIQSAASKGGAELFNTIIDYIDKAIGQLGLGHELSSQSSPGSGQLGITAALQVRQDIVEGDCKVLSSVHRRDLLVPMVGWNWGWDKLHLVPYSVFDCEPQKDLGAQSAVLATVARAFPELEFSIQQIRDEFAWDSPLGPKDVITAGRGAAVGQQPSGPAVPQDPAQPEVTVNRVLSARKGKRATPTAKQKKVDKLAEKVIAGALVETEKWKAQLRSMIREALAEGQSIPGIAHRVATAYPDLDAANLERLLHDQLVLVRLFGRNG